MIPMIFDQLSPTILTSSDNLNSITENGYYTWASSRTPTNAPFPNTSCNMEVTDFTTTGYCMQKVYATYKFAVRYMSRNGAEIGSWYTYWNKTSIQTAIRNEFVPRKLEIDGRFPADATYTVIRSGNGFNFINTISTSAGNYTGTVQIGTTTTTKYVPFGTVQHSAVKEWMLNRYSATVTIDDVPINNAITLGPCFVTWDSNAKAGTTGTYLVRTSSTQWTLCFNVAQGTESTSWKWTPSTSYVFRPFTYITPNTIIANSYDTYIWG